MDRLIAEIEKAKRDLKVDGVTITRQPMSQYGGQESFAVRRYGNFFYYVSREAVHQLELEGLVSVE